MKDKSMYTKEFYEHYAKQCLELAYDRKYSMLQKSESPDWHSMELDVGIEVTQGISKKKGHTRAVMNNYFGKGYPGEYIPEELLDMDTGEIYLNPYIDITGRQIRRAYLGKTEKLNKHYKVYESNQLFIFAFRAMTEKDLYECFDINLDRFSINFDICYINCIDRMYICDFLQRSITDEIKISIDKLVRIKESAMLISQHGDIENILSIEEVKA